MPDFVGTSIADRYTLERELGRGGMATVWLARDQRHDRPVAVKILHAELAGAIGVDRFIREVRLTARLQHPNILPVLDSGALALPEGPILPWYAMTYLEGRSLRDRLVAERQLPIEEALRIADAVGGALQAAHAQGVVHRDIKPENILLTDDRVYVLDFGIAKALIEIGGERLTSTGLIIGTPAYMSPEQASADQLDARSDQYSLATVLYEMLVGETPFTGGTVQALVARRLAEPARPIHPVRPSVPVAVEEAVLRALERVPADRFPDVGAFTAALGPTATTESTRRAGRPVGRRPMLIVAGLVAIMLIGWLVASRPSQAGRRLANPEVVSLTKAGRRAYDRRTPAGAIEAIATYSRAVALDSNYTPAWAGLAEAYARALERWFEIPGLPRDSLMQRGVAALDRVLAADSSSAPAWAALAHVTRLVDPTELGPSVRAAQRALALDSTNAEALHFLALDRAESGDLAGATAIWRRCVAMNPAYIQGVAFLAIAHYWHRSYDSAAVWADSAVALDPNYLLARTVVGYVAVERRDFPRSAAAFDAAHRLSNGVEVVNTLASRALASARAGRRAEAGAALRQVDSLAPATGPVSAHTSVYVAHVYAALGARDQAIAWLQRFDAPRDLHFQLHLRCDPPFDPIRADRRFQALLITPPLPAGRGC
jgi:tetratricopeptide (TPR) repeat protein